MFDFQIFYDRFDDQVSWLNGFVQIRRAVNSVNGVFDEFLSFAFIVFKLFFRNASQAIFDASSGLFYQIIVHFDQCHLVTRGGRHLNEKHNQKQ